MVQTANDVQPIYIYTFAGHSGSEVYYKLKELSRPNTYHRIYYPDAGELGDNDVFYTALFHSGYDIHIPIDIDMTKSVVGLVFDFKNTLPGSGDTLIVRTPFPTLYYTIDDDEGATYTERDVARRLKMPRGKVKKVLRDLMIGQPGIKIAGHSITASHFRDLTFSKAEIVGFK